MKTKRAHAAMIAAAFWMTLSMSPSWAADEIFRCGSNTAVRGDTTVRVFSSAGNPISRRNWARRRKAPSSHPTRALQHPSREKKRVEKWHYNRGVGDYIYALTFENGVLHSVESTGRGM